MLLTHYPKTFILSSTHDILKWSPSPGLRTPPSSARIPAEYGGALLCHGMTDRYHAAILYVLAGIAALSFIVGFLIVWANR
jgi:hypothetical protein